MAQSLVETLSDPDRGGADIGVVNPGGLRQELLYAPDGTITYSEANAVLPFVINLWTTNLTGAQIKVMLEQQWQTNADGTIPSRSYLQLGLSKNITYTYDSSRDLGDRITSITINEAPIDPQTQYTVATFSFLAQGGDNFRVFKEGSGTRDSGLIDRDAWIAYLTAHPNLDPDFARSSAEISQLPSSVTVSETVNFTVGRVDVHSLGAPLNTTLEASLEGGSILESVAVGSFNFVDHVAAVQFEVPAQAQGASTLKLVAPDSGTTILIPLDVEAVQPQGVASSITLKAKKSVASKPTRFDVTIKTEEKVAQIAGTVELREGDKVVASVEVPKETPGKKPGKKPNKKPGKKSVIKKLDVSLEVVLPAGSRTITAVFVPSDQTIQGSQSKPLVLKTAQAK